MKKFLVLMCLSLMVMAGVEDPFMQLGSYKWDKEGTQRITLTVPADSYVYLTNFVLDWTSTPINDLKNVYNMNPNQYGWFSEADINAETGEYDWHRSDGSVAKVTYTNDYYLEGVDEMSKKSTNGYFLDYFKDSMDIYLVMTALPHDGGETVDSYQELNGENSSTTLKERYVDYDDDDDALAVGKLLSGADTDAAENHFANFGFMNGGYREFVAVYTQDDEPHTSGQPLPNILLSSLLVCGIFATRKIRRNAVK